MDHVKTALSGLKPGEPTTHGGLTVFPLTSDLPGRLRYLLLEDGLRKDLVTIREVSEGGSVPELKMENRAGLPVLIVDGEELVGAKQNRVANLTMLIPADRVTIIPVSCVEAGRWSYRTPDFDVSDRVQNARGRAEKLESVRHSLRERGSRDSDQGQVWDSIAAESEVLGAPSPNERDGGHVRAPQGDAGRLRRRGEGRAGAVGSRLHRRLVRPLGRAICRMSCSSFLSPVRPRFSPRLMPDRLRLP